VQRNHLLNAHHERGTTSQTSEAYVHEEEVPRASPLVHVLDPVDETLCGVDNGCTGCCVVRHEVTQTHWKSHTEAYEQRM